MSYADGAASVVAGAGEDDDSLRSSVVRAAGDVATVAWGFAGGAASTARGYAGAAGSLAAGFVWSSMSQAAGNLWETAAPSLVAAKRQSTRMLLPGSVEARTPVHWACSGPSKHVEVVRLPQMEEDAEFGKLLEPGGQLGGRDLRYRHPVGYRKFSIARVWRIENPVLWFKYHAERERLSLSVARASDAGVKVPSVSVRMGFREATSRLPIEIVENANEAYLAHATTPENILPIINHGFNGGFASEGAFGMGTYFAEDIGKCDQYVRPDHDFKDSPEVYELHDQLYPDGPSAHPEDVFYVFVCRVLLGVFAQTRDSETCLNTGIPVWRASGKDKTTQRELAAIPQISPPEPFHALVVEASREKGACLKRYREFISFHADSRVYPEYLIAYRRVPPRLPRE